MRLGGKNLEKQVALVPAVKLLQVLEESQSNQNGGAGGASQTSMALENTDYHKKAPTTEVFEELLFK